jgi:hypothetical protein
MLALTLDVVDDVVLSLRPGLLITLSSTLPCSPFCGAGETVAVASGKSSAERRDACMAARRCWMPAIFVAEIAGSALGEYALLVESEASELSAVGLAIAGDGVAWGNFSSGLSSGLSGLSWAGREGSGGTKRLRSESAMRPRASFFTGAIGEKEHKDEK